MCIGTQILMKLLITPMTGVGIKTNSAARNLTSFLINLESYLSNIITEFWLIPTQESGNLKHFAFVESSLMFLTLKAF